MDGNGSERRQEAERCEASTDLEEGGSSGDVLQRARVEAADPLSLRDP